jgi:molybdenum-dependent DNA-binding transcriptional regulator ModE
MMFRRKPKAVPDMQVVDNHLIVTPTTAQKDETVARLTVRADMILEELDGVIQQMSTMLKDSVK